MCNAISYAALQNILAQGQPSMQTHNKQFCNTFNYRCINTTAVFDFPIDIFFCSQLLASSKIWLKIKLSLYLITH